MADGIIYHQLKAAPTKPGVYLLKDFQGKVIYVGKAGSLRHRLRSYFSPTAKASYKIQRLVSSVADFEFIVTDSEAEALILENTLIKSRKPIYNTRLKDDKTYPYLKIGLNEEFPQVYITRRVVNDGARYFGPYANAGSVHKTMNLLKKLFPYRSCTRTITGNDPRPCLEHYINRCVAPCTGAATKEEYHKVISQVILFMEGNTASVIKELSTKMDEASAALEFERASVLRDQLRAIASVTEGQKVASLAMEDNDIIAIARGSSDEICVQVFFVRRGQLVGREQFIMTSAHNDDSPHVLADFVKQYYASATQIPQRLLLQHTMDDDRLITEWLSKKRGTNVELIVPKRGEKRKLVAMVAENANQGLLQLKSRWLTDINARESAMKELQEQLNLPRLPRRVECYDISNLQGTTPVGSMVVFEDGQPKASHYRRFQIKTVDGIDDYAMMQEMLLRRFHHLRPSIGNPNKPLSSPDKHSYEERPSWKAMPDLVLIDGGKGHLNSVVEVFLALGIDDIPLASLAKAKEEIFVRDTPESIMLPRDSKALFLVQRLRDEAHRFAITYHQKSRTRKAMQSALDLVPGIGVKRKRILLRRFGSIKGVKAASLHDLASVQGMTTNLAQKIKEYL